MPQLMQRAAKPVLKEEGQLEFLTAKEGIEPRIGPDKHGSNLPEMSEEKSVPIRFHPWLKNVFCLAQNFSPRTRQNTRKCFLLSLRFITLAFSF
jgi:hypothetical protein